MSKVTTKQVFAVADQIRAQGYLVGQAYDPFKPHQLVLPKPATNIIRHVPKIADIKHDKLPFWIEFYRLGVAKEKALLLQAERRKNAYQRSGTISGTLALLLAGTGAYKSTQHHSMGSVNSLFTGSSAALLTSVLCFMAARRAFRAATSHTTQKIIDQGNVSALETIKRQIKRAGPTTPTAQLPG